MTQPPYPLHPKPLNRSWIERNPLWKIPLGCLTLLLLMVLFGFGLFVVIDASFHHSDVYKQAIARASEDVQVRQLIGEPIKPGWMIVGELKINNSTGYANFSIPISGPRGKGHIRVVANKNGVWRFSYLQVYVDGRPECIDLLSTQPANREGESPNS